MTDNSKLYWRFCNTPVSRNFHVNLKLSNYLCCILKYDAVRGAEEWLAIIFKVKHQL